MVLLDDVKCLWLTFSHCSVVSYLLNREPVKTEPQEMGHSTRSSNKPQHCVRHSSQRNGRMVF